ncbi:uncharacterized protein [Amphiura filiformis]|uniref:uncharacterized protein n=1 Tax=Amphiura filiformis TaxID=82378 RepID=UPI003B216280
MSIKDVKEKYPLLFCADEIMAEFHRLTEVNLYETIEEPDIKEVLHSISQMRQPTKSPGWMKQDSKQDTALLALPGHLNEDISSFMQFSTSPASASAVILVNDKDGIRICPNQHTRYLWRRSK